MTPSDYDRFASSLDAVMGLYSNQRPLSDAGRALWFRALTRYALADIERAFERHVTNASTGQFPPKPADIIRTIDGTPGERAAAAWAKVHGAIVRVGQYSNLVFDDPLIHAALDAMGNWATLAETESSDMPFRARDFASHYERLSERPPERYPAMIGGIGNPADVVYIGDRTLALAVQSNGGGKALALNFGLPVALPGKAV